MTLPVPESGLVIRYSYLWHREFEKGVEDGGKDRPCAIVLTIQEVADIQRIVALPVTHSPPGKDDEAIEIPSAIKQHLGLDSGRSWIMLGESNLFRWPGPDLRLDPATGAVDYGFLPPRFFAEVKRRFLGLEREARSIRVTRSE